MQLPERVRRAIKEQEGSSEIVIGWTQLCVVVTWSALYTLSPKTFSSTAEFEPIPWVLSLYFVFTVVRLIAAYKGYLPRWLLSLSVVSDVSLLMITIWSFHLQYMQPAPFYLKAPTLLYVFIFIALRSLRFEPGYVILAGVVSAVGWLGMLAYAIGDGEMEITRDYIHYLTSNSVLIGAEADKIISILMVTGILAVSLARARALLVRAVRESFAAGDLSRFFDKGVADRITQADGKIGAGHGEIRNASILNVDIRGFTAYAERVSPAEVVGMLARYQALVVPIVQSNGGTIDKFLGDGIMATFGATERSDAHAAAAMRTMEAILDATDAWLEPDSETGRPATRVCAAVSSGDIVFGAVGSGARLEYTVIGSAVNKAAKLEKHTKVEDVRGLVDQSSYEQAVSQGFRPRSRFENRTQRTVMGIEGDVDVLVRP